MLKLINRGSIKVLLTGFALTGSQIFGLTGKVVEAHAQDPVPGASVYVEGGTDTVSTDAQGMFTLTTSGLNQTLGADALRASIRGGVLYLDIQSGGTLEISMFNTGGATLLNKKSGRFAAGSRYQIDLHQSTKGAQHGIGIHYLVIKLDNKTALYKVTSLSDQSREMLLSSSGPFPFNKKASGAGTVTVRIDKLIPKNVEFTTGEENLGDIVLEYPERVVDVGALPPYGAEYLFDGSRGQTEAQDELNAKWGPWETLDGTREDELGITFKVVSDPEHPGDENYWTLQSCCLQRWGPDDLQTEEVHGDVQIHVELNMMGEYDDDMNPDANVNDDQGGRQPGYTNSGVYVQSRYEIQIESSRNRDEITTNTHRMASLVDQKSPDSNEMRDNGEWQAYDITFRTSRWDGDTRLEHGYITVYWNGVKVHDNVEATAPATGIANTSGEEMTKEIYGLKLQSEATDCRYRNIWWKHLTIEEAETDFGY